MADENPLQQLLNTDEGKQQFSEMAKELGFVSNDEYKEKLDTEVSGLKSKRDELLEKLTKKEETVEIGKKTKQLLDNHGIPSYNDLEDLLDRLKNPNDSDEIRELKRFQGKAEIDLKKAQGTIETLNSELQGTEGFIKSILTESKLQNLCSQQGCTSAQSEAITSYLLKNNAFQVLDDNGIRKAVTEDGQTVDEFFNNWLNTDKAKELLPAKRNSGGGAISSIGVSGNNDIASEYKKAVDRGDTMTAIKLSRKLNQ